MAYSKEIRGKIVSVQSMQKITKAMEMVAVSKMRKAHERMSFSRSYLKIMSKVIGHLMFSNLEYKHPYLDERIVKRVGYIVVTTDRGLVGSLNVNLFRKLLTDMKNWDMNGIETELALIGFKAVSFFNSIGRKVVSQVSSISDNPTISEFIDPIKAMLQTYDKNKIDKLYIASNKFINTLSIAPQILQILPLPLAKKERLKNKSWDYLYEPDPKTILDNLLYRYIESQVYQSVVENLASEQAMRMITMKTATDNSSNLIKELQFIYNKVRQANVTQELTEIISGAIAI